MRRYPLNIMFYISYRGGENDLQIYIYWSSSITVHGIENETLKVITQGWDEEGGVDVDMDTVMPTHKLEKTGVAVVGVNCMSKKTGLRLWNWDIRRWN